MNHERSIHVTVHGQVQGVGFRAWTHHQAELHGLAGWVRNRRDGTVEAVFSGAEEAIAVMLKACREGPRGSRVERVDESEAEMDIPSSGEGFRVRETV